MKIGNYEVKVLDKDKVKVGCQTVKRSEIVEILAAMENPPADFEITSHVCDDPSWFDFTLKSNDLNIALLGDSNSWVPEVRIQVKRENAKLIKDFLNKQGLG